MTDRRCPGKSALLGARVARTLLALAGLAAAGSALAQQRPAPAAAAQAQSAETWRRDYAISLPLGDGTTRETLRLRAMNQARERASGEFGAIVLHEQALHGDALSSQTRVLSAGLVRLSLRSETVRQVQGDSTFWVDYAIEAQIDPAELERQAAALRGTVQRDQAIRALQQENEELRRALRASAAAASPPGGQDAAGRAPAQQPALAPRVSIPDAGHSTPLPDLAAQRARSEAQDARDLEYASSVINELMLDAYRRAPKEVEHSIFGGTGIGGTEILQVNVGVQIKVPEEYWNSIGTQGRSDGHVSGSKFPGCFVFLRHNHFAGSLKYSLYAEISIGGVAAYRLLSAGSISGKDYCGRRNVRVTLWVPRSVLESSREILVRVLPRPEVPSNIPTVDSPVQPSALRDEPEPIAVRPRTNSSGAAREPSAASVPTRTRP